MAQRILGERHAPAQQILDRCKAHRLAEPARKGRARHARLLRQFGDGPAPAHIGVDVGKRPGELRVRKAAQHARVRKPRRFAPQRFDK
ncbi:hypothetical protein D9M70_619540 [compost metagenome]